MHLQFHLHQDFSTREKVRQLPYKHQLIPRQWACTNSGDQRNLANAETEFFATLALTSCCALLQQTMLRNYATASNFQGSRGEYKINL